MSALDGQVKRWRGRPCETGWRNAGAVRFFLGADLEAALEEYDPQPQNKTKTLRGLIEIGLAALRERVAEEVAREEGGAR